jgi:hypothetical protein
MTMLMMKPIRSAREVIHEVIDKNMNLEVRVMSAAPPHSLLCTDVLY